MTRDDLHVEQDVFVDKREYEQDDRKRPSDKRDETGQESGIFVRKQAHVVTSLFIARVEASLKQVRIFVKLAENHPRVGCVLASAEGPGIAMDLFAVLEDKVHGLEIMCFGCATRTRQDKFPTYHHDDNERRKDEVDQTPEAHAPAQAVRELVLCCLVGELWPDHVVLKDIVHEAVNVPLERFCQDGRRLPLMRLFLESKNTERGQFFFTLP